MGVQEREKKKLARAELALGRMGDDIYKLYCELMEIGATDMIDRLLISIDTDELIAAIDNVWMGYVDPDNA